MSAPVTLKRKRFLSLGTRSVLFGAHQFILHPLFLAVAWTKLYGFPLDPRLWAAFFLHDVGYLGKDNLDGAEGETHPELGGRRDASGTRRKGHGHPLWKAVGRIHNVP